MQRFIARERREFSNGAIGWAPSGPLDCLGPYAKVENCPIVVLDDGKRRDTGLRRTCYAQGYADSYFSIPAACKIQGRRVKGFLTGDDGGGVVFILYQYEREKVGL